MLNTFGSRIGGMQKARSFYLKACLVVWQKVLECWILLGDKIGRADLKLLRIHVKRFWNYGVDLEKA